MGYRDRQSTEEADERSLIFENGAVDRPGRSQGVVQNNVNDSSLFVAEELAQRKRFLCEALIQLDDHVRCIRLGEGLDQFLVEVFFVVSVSRTVSVCVI